MFKSIWLSLALHIAAICGNGVQAGPVSNQGTWESTLQARDLNGDGATDAFYDTDLKITWLSDTQLNGPMTWNDAKAWADDYIFGGFLDWRLPTAMNSNGTEPCEGYQCIGSEMGHLWYVTLGNTQGNNSINSGNYSRLGSNFYWTSTSAEDSFIRWGYRTPAWGFRTFDGAQYLYYKGEQLYAMAVRDGDVLTTPEPESLWLMLTGLGALVLFRRRRVYGSTPGASK